MKHIGKVYDTDLRWVHFRDMIQHCKDQAEDYQESHEDDLTEKDEIELKLAIDLYAILLETMDQVKTVNSNA